MRTRILFSVPSAILAVVPDQVRAGVEIRHRVGIHCSDINARIQMQCSPAQANLQRLLSELLIECDMSHQPCRSAADYVREVFAIHAPVPVGLREAEPEALPAFSTL